MRRTTSPLMSRVLLTSSPPNPDADPTIRPLGQLSCSPVHSSGTHMAHAVVLASYRLPP